MSVLEEVLKEEYDRSMRLIGLMEQELSTLPRGSIRMRVIGGHEYCYLNHREGKRVVSDYIKQADVDEIKKKIARRKELKEALKVQRDLIKRLQRALGVKGG